jgi:S1-C subfamily serine protease
MSLIDPLLFATARLSTFNGTLGLTNATGFFFRRDHKLFLVTSRHVFIDEALDHHPDRIEIELHLDADNAVRSTGWSVLLYKDERAAWRQGRDKASEIDVAAIEIEEDKLPKGTALQAFTVEHLADDSDEVAIGQPLVIPGFPLGFHDAMHHLPVARHAAVASPWGLRFQGEGYFLTDARTHSGTSGAPVVMRMHGDAVAGHALRWKLLGIHSSRLDMGNRDHNVDESLGLNISWYADILLTLTAARAPLTRSP